VSGKPAGLDFEQHKMTLLVALAAQRRHEVHDLVISPEPDLDRLRSLLVTTGIRAEMERLIDDLVGQGLRAVENAPIPRPWRDELAAMARQVAYRDR
jgi:geranylgeranyl diphosphate synthase type I